MDVIIVFTAVTLVLVAVALWAFVWSVRNDQFDDLEREGWSILFDERGGRDPGVHDARLRDRGPNDRQHAVGGAAKP